MRNKGRERGRKDRRKEVRREDKKLAACFTFTPLLCDCVRSWLSNAFQSLMKCKSRRAINSHHRGSEAGSLQAGPHCYARTTPSKGSTSKSHAWWISHAEKR